MNWGRACHMSISRMNFWSGWFCRLDWLIKLKFVPYSSRLQMFLSVVNPSRNHSHLAHRSWSYHGGGWSSICTPHMKIDVQDLDDVDFFAFSGLPRWLVNWYRCRFGKRKYLEQMSPVGNLVVRSWFRLQAISATDWKELPGNLRLEHGNAGGCNRTCCCSRLSWKIGMDAIEAHEQEQLRTCLPKHGQLRIDHLRFSGLISTFRGVIAWHLEDLRITILAAALDYGRSGCSLLVCIVRNPCSSI